MCTAVSCEPAYLPGMTFSSQHGVSRLSRDDRSTSDFVEMGATARFILEKPVIVNEGTDLSISMQGTGTVRISAYSEGTPSLLLAQGIFTIIGGKKAELHVRIATSGTLEVLEIAADSSGKATLIDLSIEPAMYGFWMDDNSYAIDNATTIQGSVGGMPRKSIINNLLYGSSLVLESSSKGYIDILARDSSGAVTSSLRAAIDAPLHIAIPLSLFASAASVELDSSAGLKSALMIPGDGAPLSDLYAILAAPSGTEHYSLYRWDILPETLVFDFKNYEIQDSYLKRLAFFAEKPGFRGRLASDDEIASLHGWNAHDYSSTTLAAFFSKANLTGFRLNGDELGLQELLLKYGILVRDAAGTIVAGRGAIISISRESSSQLRRTFIDHESSHALFFQDVNYRNLAGQLWAGLGKESRYYWITHFDWRRYDTTDEYLCVNELQAYLMQQSLQALLPYYQALTKRLVSAYPDKAPVIESAAVGAMQELMVDAGKLDRYLEERWGLGAGRFGRLSVRPVP